ncbi:MAG: xanthine dehydrogenase family protein molybdopterin-binding subunit [Nitrospinota bacterium]
MSVHSIIGKDIPRIDGAPKASGEAKYAADLDIPGTLCGRILRSRHPHARILNIDTRRAERLRGVKAVVSSRNTPLVYYGTTIFDQFLFDPEKVRYLGDEVAAVAAADPDTAEEALSLIEVEYEELPAVFDVMEAIQPGAPLVHEDSHKYDSTFKVRGRQRNIACSTWFGHGDVEVGFQESDEVFEHTFATHQNHQTYLEPHAALAQPDGQGGVTVWVSTQGVFSSQSLIARVLQLPLTKVRVVGAIVGGGFGGKKPRVEMYAALLALRSGRPVRLQFTRDEDFVAGLPRHPTTIQIRTGVKRNGRLVARDAKLYYDTGAYTDHGPTIAAGGALYAKGAYRIPHVNVESFTVYTNKTISSAFRGYGCPQSTFAGESQMDIIARELGIDPLDLRRTNGMDHGDSLVNGQKLAQVWLKKTLDSAARRADWQGSLPQAKDGKRRGRGIACGMHVSGGLSSSANVKVMEDGTIQVSSGVIEIGAGQLTMAAMIAAEELGVGVEDVRLVSADTDATPFEYYTAASRVTYNVGNVVRLAAADAKKQLLERASELMEVPVEDLAVAHKRIYLPGAPERGMTIGQVAKGALTKKGGPILGRGIFEAVGPPALADCQDGSPRKGVTTMTFCTHIAEVEVDEETGQVEVLRLICAHDVGQVINLGGIVGQLQGGVTQGFGYTLIEEVVYSGGVITNPSLVDYKVPNILDVPPIEYDFIEEPEPTGPFGAKGFSEAVLVPTAPAIANAIHDAVGIRVKDLPLTAEKILSGLQAKA